MTFLTGFFFCFAFFRVCLLLWKSTFLDLTREVSTAPNVTFKWECLPLTELLLSNPGLMWAVKKPGVERIPPSQLVIYEHS